MEQHPIPQDVTGFQFKLIGSMTVKQFGYVAVGVVSAFLLYYIPLHFFLSFMIKLLLIPLFGASGFVIAFIPIEGRPIDQMAMNFIKAIFAPNQYVYHKAGRKFSFSTVKLEKPVIQPTATTIKHVTSTQHSSPQHDHKVALDKNKRLQEYLRSTSQHPKTEIDKKEESLLDTFERLSTSATTEPEPMILSGKEVTLPMQSQAAATSPLNVPVLSPMAPQPPVQVQIEPPKVELPKPADKEPEEVKIPLPAQELPKPEMKPLEPPKNKEELSQLERQLQDMHSQKQQLEDEVMKLRNQLESAKKKPVVPSQAQQPEPSQRVRNIPQPMTKNAGLAYVPDTPNVIVGIVKDSRGNVLPGVLVEIKDKDGNPVRAFKTNALGQFASATPLAMGTYTIELEDPKKQHSFDIIQIVTKNEILSPIEIISHDAREELRKALFN